MFAGREIVGREGRVNGKAVKKDGSENIVALCELAKHEIIIE